MRFSLVMALLLIVGCSGGGGGGASSDGGDGGGGGFIYYGCTDLLAINYNPNATRNDGSCIYNNDPDENEPYVPVFTAPQNPYLHFCGGTQILPYKLTGCKRGNSNVSSNYCDGATPPDPITFKGPAGKKTVLISNGTKYITCAEGASEAEATSVEYVCYSGFQPGNGGCVSTPDTSIPVVTWKEYPPTSVNQFVARFSFEAEEESQFFCEVDGGITYPCGNGYAGSHSYSQLASINGKQHTLKVWAVDAAGNSGEHDSSKYKTHTWSAWGNKTVGLYDFEGNGETQIDNKQFGFNLNDYGQVTHEPGFNGGGSYKVLTGYHVARVNLWGKPYDFKDYGMTIEAFVREINKTVDRDMPLISTGNMLEVYHEVGIRYVNSNTIRMYYELTCDRTLDATRIESQTISVDLNQFTHVAFAQKDKNVHFYLDGVKVSSHVISGGGCKSENKFTPAISGYSGIIGESSLNSRSGNGIDFIDRLRISRFDRTQDGSGIPALCRVPTICPAD